nr:MAG TPA: hypothetical protein [Caudoviricetes sp.]
MTLTLDYGIIYLVHEHQRIAQIRAILFCVLTIQHQEHSNHVRYKPIQDK